MAFPILYPEINGNRFSWSSIELRILTRRFLGFKSLKMSEELDPEMVYGAHAQPIGRTRGDLKTDASVEMNKEEADQVLDLLGLAGGYMEAEFGIFAAFKEGVKISTRELHNCRIKKIDESHSKGTEALTTTFDLSVMFLTRNGKSPLTNMLTPLVP